MRWSTPSPPRLAQAVSEGGRASQDRAPSNRRLAGLYRTIAADDAYLSPASVDRRSRSPSTRTPRSRSGSTFSISSQSFARIRAAALGQEAHPAGCGVAPAVPGLGSVPGGPAAARPAGGVPQSLPARAARRRAMTMDAIGRTTWVIPVAGCRSPARGRSPFTSHDKLCLLNAGDEIAEHRDCDLPRWPRARRAYRLTIAPRRIRHIASTI